MNDCKYKSLRTKYKVKLTLITIGNRNKLNMISFIKMIINFVNSYSLAQDFGTFLFALDSH